MEGMDNEPLTLSSRFTKKKELQKFNAYNVIRHFLDLRDIKNTD